MEATATIDTRASIDIRSVVLPRANWERVKTPNGVAVRPQKGTWYAHVVRGTAAHDVTIIPMIACPACGGLVYLSHTLETAKALGAMLGRPGPVAHSIDRIGRVSPDVMCRHGRCAFHRRVILDRWNKTKALYAVAYVDSLGGGHGRIQIDYCHAVDRKEALFHFARGKNRRLIDAGPAVGFFVNEQTGRVTAD